MMFSQLDGFMVWRDCSMRDCGEMVSDGWVVLICVYFLQDFVFGLCVHFMPRVSVIASFARILVELSIARICVVVVI